MVKKPKKRILGYCRCSTTEQATEGLSLDVQKAKITAYCELNDLILIDSIEDAGISGKSLSRPGIQSILQRLKSGEADALVVLKLDRLSRSTRDVLHIVEIIEQSNWELHSISERLDTSTASGRFTITILSALAQMEREQVGERTSLALQHKKMNGDRLGTTPYGFETVEDGEGKRVLRPRSDDQRILHRISVMQSQGTSLAKIADTLNREAIPSKRGGQWYPSSVHSVIHKVISKTFDV